MNVFFVLSFRFNGKNMQKEFMLWPYANLKKKIKLYISDWLGCVSCKPKKLSQRIYKDYIYLYPEYIYIYAMKYVHEKSSWAFQSYLHTYLFLTPIYSQFSRLKSGITGSDNISLQLWICSAGITKFNSVKKEEIQSSQLLF